MIKHFNTFCCILDPGTMANATTTDIAASGDETTIEATTASIGMCACMRTFLTFEATRKDYRTMKFK